MLAELHQELLEMGITLRLSRVQLSARSLLDRTGITEQIGAQHFHARTLFAVAQYLTEEGLSKRVSCDILPDMVRSVLDMVSARAGLVKGEEQERLDVIQSQLEDILRELETMPCEIP